MIKNTLIAVILMATAAPISANASEFDVNQQAGAFALDGVIFGDISTVMMARACSYNCRIVDYDQGPVPNPPRDPQDYKPVSPNDTRECRIGAQKLCASGGCDYVTNPDAPGTGNYVCTPKPSSPRWTRPPVDRNPWRN
jgi:hypothetical protein